MNTRINTQKSILAALVLCAALALTQLRADEAPVAAPAPSPTPMVTPETISGIPVLTYVPDGQTTPTIKVVIQSNGDVAANIARSDAEFYIYLRTREAAISAQIEALQNEYVRISREATKHDEAVRAALAAYAAGVRQ